MATTKDEQLKLRLWIARGEQPPTQAADQRDDQLPSDDDEEVQYNIRLRKSLKARLKRLVTEENKPMGAILETMLDLYLQRRGQTTKVPDHSDGRD